MKMVFIFINWTWKLKADYCWQKNYREALFCVEQLAIKAQWHWGGDEGLKKAPALNTGSLELKVKINIGRYFKTCS